jgi:hypothetical protein
MGLFGNSQTKEFKNKMADVWNLIASFSYGELSASVTTQIINVNYNQLKKLYSQFASPFEETFNAFTTFTSVFGDKTLIAEGMYIIYLARELAFKGQRISTGVHQRIIAETRTLCSTYSGRNEIIRAINNS